MSEDEKARVAEHEKSGDDDAANRKARAKAIKGAPVSKMAEGPAKNK